MGVPRKVICMDLGVHNSMISVLCNTDGRIPPHHYLALAYYAKHGVEKAMLKPDEILPLWGWSRVSLSRALGAGEGRIGDLVSGKAVMRPVMSMAIRQVCLGVRKVKPRPGSTWEHSNGNRYEVVLLANEHSVNEKYVTTVVYRGVNNRIWSRPLSDWHRSMRFLSDKQKRGNA